MSRWYVWRARWGWSSWAALQWKAPRSRPKDKNGKPRGDKPDQRDFGVPPPETQDSFTDPPSRIMKRAGGGFDDSDNAQSAMDEAAHIMVAAELLSPSSEVYQLAPVLDAVKANTKSDPKQVLADVEYRNEKELAKLATKKPEIELVIALGREGR